jgi:outer membrane protein assembly factor BamB
MSAIARINLSAIALSFFYSVVCYSDDWPEWRGGQRDGVSVEKDWLANWPEKADPKVLWRASVGKGHSAVSVSQGRAYTMGWDGKRDTVFCLDANTGKILWKQSYDCASIKQWPGPRATPTVHRDRVYTLGQHGQLYCFDALSGKPIWSKTLSPQLMPDNDYGFAWSPLVESEHLIFCAGKAGLALRIADGSVAWGDDKVAGTCASAVRFDHDGTRGVAVIVNKAREQVAIVGVEPKTGKVIWQSEDWPEKWGAACVDPLVENGKVFLTTAEQHQQCAVFRIDGARLVREWSNRKLACYTGSCVSVKGHIYGVSKVGLLTCLDWKSGKEMWSERGFDGHGALIAVDGHLLVQSSQNGNLTVVRADPEMLDIVRRFKVFTQSPSSFTAPVLANGRIYCRSYEGEIVCLAVGR